MQKGFFLKKNLIFCNKYAVVQLTFLECRNMYPLEKEFLEKIEKHKGVIFKSSKMYMNNSDKLKDLFQVITFQVWKAYLGF